MEYDILMFLHNNPQYDTATDIIKIRHLTKSHVSMALKNLEKRGLLQSFYAVDNKKSRHLRIMPSAADIVTAGEAAQQQFGHRLFQDFTEDEIAAQIICRASDFERKRFVRYCGTVIESFATMENLRRRGASRIQLIV